MSFDIKNMSKEELVSFLEKLAHEEFFSIKENALPKSLDYFQKTIENFDKMNNIDTSSVEPLNYPIENTHFHLRRDDEIREFNNKQILEWLDTRKHTTDEYMEIKYEK